MSIYMFHFVTVMSGALMYATLEMEGDGPSKAAGALEAKLTDGSTVPSWRPVTDPLVMKDGTKAYLVGLQGLDDEDDRDMWPRQGSTGAGAGATGKAGAETNAPGGTSPSGGVTLPLNASAVPAAARNVRNMAPLAQAPIQAGFMPPAKSRPGELPVPVVGGAPDPTKSPTPAADGVTHLPLAQRSMAVPTPGRTIGTRSAGDMSTLRQQTPAEEELAANARRPGHMSNASADTANTGGPTPQAAAAEAETLPEPAATGEAEAPAAATAETPATATGEGQGDPSTDTTGAAGTGKTNGKNVAA